METVIAEHGGDPRAAVRALLEVNLRLEEGLAWGGVCGQLWV
jgi:hypothetical protein